MAPQVLVGAQPLRPHRPSERYVKGQRRCNGGAILHGRFVPVGRRRAVVDVIRAGMPHDKSQDLRAAETVAPGQPVDHDRRVLDEERPRDRDRLEHRHHHPMGRLDTLRVAGRSGGKHDLRNRGAVDRCVRPLLAALKERESALVQERRLRKCGARARGVRDVATVHDGGVDERVDAPQPLVAIAPITSDGRGDRHDGRACAHRAEGYQRVIDAVAAEDHDGSTGTCAERPQSGRHAPRTRGEGGVPDRRPAARGRGSLGQKRALGCALRRRVEQGHEGRGGGRGSRRTAQDEHAVAGALQIDQPPIPSSTLPRIRYETPRKSAMTSPVPRVTVTS